MKRTEFDHKGLTEDDLENGLAWIEGDEDYLFYYSVPSQNEGGGMGERYDYSTLRKDTDVKKEYEWVEWSELYSYLGMDEQAFNDMPLPQKVSEILSYYGFINVFGDPPMSGGLTYKEVLDPEYDEEDSSEEEDSTEEEE